MAGPNHTPTIQPLGEAALLVEFAPYLTDAANRAALAFRAAVERAGWEGVVETASTLKSVVVGFDPEDVAHEALTSRIADLLGSRDWSGAPLPSGRRLWRVPAAFGREHGPALDEVADLAGLTAAQAVEEVAASRLRVLAMGFAPGQPYLGLLPDHWDIPRQSALTPRVPAGAVVAAVRQLTLFSVPAQTGWRQIGQAAIRLFDPDGDPPFPLKPGDEIAFEPVSAAEFARLGDAAARPEALA